MLLAARSRESRGEMLARLAHTIQHDLSSLGDVAIHNSGKSDVAGERFLAVLHREIAFSDVSGLALLTN